MVEPTLRSTPKDATHWSIRSMAAATGFFAHDDPQDLNSFRLQAHRWQTFKLSSDPLFVDKVRDIIGLYLSPPNRALVFSVDENGLDVHVIMDNYAAHKTAVIKTWLAGGRTVTFTSCQYQRRGPIRSSAGSPNSPESNCDEVSTPPRSH